MFAFLRKAGDAQVIVALNMSSKSTVVTLDWDAHGGSGTTLNPLYKSANYAVTKPHVMELPAFGAVVAELH